MTPQVKLRVRVYSDCEVRNPQAYFTRVFQDYDQWELLNSDDTNCILCQTKEQYDLDEHNLDQLDDLYDSITPEMYMSTSRSYVKV